MDGLPDSQDVPHRLTSRVAWSIGLLGATLGIAYLVLLWVNGVDPQDSESWLAGAVMAIVFPAVGALIVGRYRAHILGWLMLTIGLLSAIGAVADEYATLTLRTYPGLMPGGEFVAWVGSFTDEGAFYALPLVLLLFPDGRPPSRRWRPVAWVTVLAGWP